MEIRPMLDDPTDDSPQSKGGKARAEVLSPDELSAAGKRAALARWGHQGRTLEASHEGELPLGDTKLEVYNLEDGRRDFAKRGIARAFGLKSKGGNAFMKTPSGISLGCQIPAE